MDYWDHGADRALPPVRDPRLSRLFAHLFVRRYCPNPCERPYFDRLSDCCTRPAHPSGEPQKYNAVLTTFISPYIFDRQIIQLTQFTKGPQEGSRTSPPLTESVWRMRPSVETMASTLRPFRCVA